MQITDTLYANTATSKKVSSQKSYKDLLGQKMPNLKAKIQRGGKIQVKIQICTQTTL